MTRKGSVADPLGETTPGPGHTADPLGQTTPGPGHTADPLGQTTPGPGHDVAQLGLTLTAAGAARSRPRPDGSRLATGTMLAHFRVESLLGKGGMGEVYRATDTSLDRPVAIKILPRAIADDPDLRERFLREARAQARLQHPHICHIYFVGEEQGHLFFAMEYVDGESLQDRLDRDGPIPPGQAIELCRMAAQGLREAHAQGFTHRDIKPSNLMLDRHGAIKVVDFGLVKQLGDASTARTQDSTAHADAQLTAIVGTPLYMAPEQARGHKADFRADIYALGTTLHHLVAGTPPFAGNSADELMTQHESAERPRLTVRKHEPSPVDVLCDRMMAKHADDRFASYDELIHAMERLSPAHTAPAGLWVRGFALAVDLLVVGLLTMLTIVLPGEPNAWFLTVLGAYTTIGHGRWGRTLGKLLLEIEVLPFLQTGRLGYGRALVRFAAQWGPLWVVAWLEASDQIPQIKVVQHTVGALSVLSVVALFLGAVMAGLRSPAKRTYWDRIVATQVCYRRRKRSE